MREYLPLILLNTQCVKVSKLRQLDNFIDGEDSKDNTLEKWMSLSNNLYVGRHGRIFITQNGTKNIFHYKGSKWCNPYKVGKGKDKYTLDESIDRYHNHIITSDLSKDLGELEGKTLGCFCDQSKKCHAKTLSLLYTQRNNLPQVIEIKEN